MRLQHGDALSIHLALIGAALEPSKPIKKCENAKRREFPHRMEWRQMIDDCLISTVINEVWCQGVST